MNMFHRSPFYRTKSLASYVQEHGFLRALSYSSRRIEASRRLYRLYRKLSPSSVLPASPSSVLGSDAKPFVESLRSDAYALGLTIPPDLLQHLCSLAVAASRTAGPILTHIKIDDLEPFRSLAADPLLLQAFRQYFGYGCSDVEIRLWCSHVVSAPTSERVASQQTVLFHFDQHAMNFLYANFYLSDVDGGSGPHIIVKGSHRRKPIRFKFASAYRSDDEIISVYGRDSVVRVCGPAGTGFLEDAWCYHKAEPPESTERLFLQFRYR